MAQHDTNSITIVELGHNSYRGGEYAGDVRVDAARFDALLADPGKVDCPLLSALGYPVILVSTTPGRQCIPVVQMVAVSRNEQNNRRATVAASRRANGRAVGCVVGNVYALRLDRRDLTAAQFEVLWRALDDLMTEYGFGPVSDAYFGQLRQRVRAEMRAGGLLPPAAAEGSACGWCDKTPEEGAQLLKCGQCRAAWYCSRECQREAWRAGHRQECGTAPPPAPTTAEVLRQQEVAQQTELDGLLEACMLEPGQVIARNVQLPPIPPVTAPNMLAMVQAMPPHLARAHVYNKTQPDRICPGCRTRYSLLPVEGGGPAERARREQLMSGICSLSCFLAITGGGPGPFAGVEYYGMPAEMPDAMTLPGGVTLINPQGYD